MARIDEVREDISFKSKLLMAGLAAIVVVGGGVAGLFLSGDRHAFALAFSYVGGAIIMSLSLLCVRLYSQIQGLIRRLGGL